MEFGEYIEKIKQQEDIIQREEYKLVNLIQQFKREHSFLQGDKVKLTREEFDVISGKKENKEYYFFIRDAYFNKERYFWDYKFAYITETGKQSDKKCAFYYHPFTDKIEKI